jgi:catechol 2,3-dioxygenase-like lactoylglutathione lyase family enzyme
MSLYVVVVALRAADQFHVGIVVPDLDAELERLTRLFGYEWGQEVSVTTPVRFPSGDGSVAFRFRYSRSRPRLEIIEQQPGTLWMPVADSGLHHLGYWSDDPTVDGGALDGSGYTLEVEGLDPAGARSWAFYGAPHGPRIELVSRALQPGLEMLYGDG